MAIGLVAVFWLVAATFAGAVLSAVAAASTHSSDLRKRRMAFAFVLPFALVGWVCPAGLLWVGWGAVTGFNSPFGIGDMWAERLPNGYSLVFVDSDTSASLHGPAGQSALVANVDQIAAAADTIYGTSGSEAFVLYTASGAVEFGPAPVFQRRWLDAGKLVPVAQYPGRARTALDDLVLWALLLGPPLFVGRYVWKAHLRDVVDATSETHDEPSGAD